ncbi:hypothetical protein V6N11_020581 [Hibiscus sabdariffa]|uniref:S-protein homolog n=1 Tax=Hibiscus sabdariffa TaxID=183260 RepID=A0ABR2Q8V7_9ROSI
MSSYSISWLLLLSLMIYYVRSVSGVWYPRTRVLINNDIGVGTHLTVHCKSKDDDLSPHVLEYRQQYDFSFRPHFFRETLFFCGMQWNGTLYWFDIYDQYRDGHRCGKHCEWNVHSEGACQLNHGTSKFDICYDWNK